MVFTHLEILKNGQDTMQITARIKEEQHVFFDIIIRNLEERLKMFDNQQAME